MSRQQGPTSLSHHSPLPRYIHRKLAQKGRTAKTQSRYSDMHVGIPRGGLTDCIIMTTFLIFGEKEALAEDASPSSPNHTPVPCSRKTSASRVSSLRISMGYNSQHGCQLHPAATFNSSQCHYKQSILTSTPTLTHKGMGLNPTEHTYTSP